MNSDFIFDNHSHLRADKFSVAVTQYPKHRITRDIALTVYPGVVAFEVIHLEKPNQLRPSITPLVETSERAASASERTDFGKNNWLEYKKQDKRFKHYSIWGRRLRN